MGVVEHHRGVTLHFQKVVLVFPNEWNVFEFLDVVSWGWHHHLGGVLLRVCEQEVVDQLLSPLDDASDNMERKHPK